LLTEEGAVVLQDAAGTEPAPAGQVMIDTVAYTPTGSVQVGGRGDAGAGLRLYLDNGEVGVASVAGDGRWLTTLGDIAPGIYTLRVDQIDAAGQVTARFETPFKRETLEALAAVSGATPASQTAASPAITAEVPTADEAPPASAEPAAESAVESVAESKTETVSDPVAEPVAPVRASAPPTVTITVQPGFTLWGIAQERMGDGMLFVQVFDANRDRIKDPDLIYPGQVFSIPASPAP
jgi:nucleoid-associated protein YgaU